jgi:hypothetical protein
MHKRFIVLLGMFLGSLAPAAAQSPAPQIDLAQEHVAPMMAMLRTVSTPLSGLSFPPVRDHGQTSASSSLRFAGAFERDHGQEPLPPMEEVKNLILTLSSLPLVQLWGGRIQLYAFQSTPHSQNLQLGLLGYGGMQGFRIPPQSYPGGTHSTRLSISFHFGRDARTERPAQAWRNLSRIVGAVLN